MSEETLAEGRRRLALERKNIGAPAPVAKMTYQGTDVPVRELAPSLRGGPTPTETPASQPAVPTPTPPSSTDASAPARAPTPDPALADLRSKK